MVAISRKTLEKSNNTIELERYERMVTEEKLDKASQKVSALEAALAKAQGDTKDTSALVRQEKEKSEQLKVELEKTTKLKELLEQQLKDALVAPPQNQTPAQEP